MVIAQLSQQLLIGLSEFTSVFEKETRLLQVANMHLLTHDQVTHKLTYKIYWDSSLRAVFSHFKPSTTLWLYFHFIIMNICDSGFAKINKIKQMILWGYAKQFFKQVHISF